MPMNPGVCTPPPTEPASVLKGMPTGVSPRNSRLTTMNPLHSGTYATMASKQPHEVIGDSMMLYVENRSTVLCDARWTYSLTPSKTPRSASRHAPLSTGWFGPVSSIS
jgi:hypothetical protein